ncbi:MAG: RsmD family RNA methyltransferase [Chitinophagales bacterium]|nr:RsmD family RNA methyltransferase [Chitinophagales bacterium]
MRIVSGKLKGKHFYPPKNIPARPTTDIAKEALFNIIWNNFDFEEIKFLDLFAGTGNIGMEMYSRGCTQITSVDLSPISIGFIQKMSKEVNIPNHIIIKGDAVAFAKNAMQTYDLIFAGPPYKLEVIDDIPNIILEKNILDKAGWFILETSANHDFSNHPNLLQVRNYGQTHFWIFTHEQFSE